MKRLTESVEVLALLKQYIETNNKLLLLKISELSSREVLPQQAYNKVYRGLSFDDDIPLFDDIKLGEQSAKYVATSPDKKTALEYANKNGVLLTYKVTQHDVIFDTRQFKDELSEITSDYADEIVINVKTSELITIQTI